MNDDLQRATGAAAVPPAPPIVPPEVAAAARADEAKPAPGAGAIAAAAPAVVDYVADAREAIDFAIDMLGELYPSLPAIYSEPVRARLAVRAGAVLKKYGVTWLDLLARYPEITLGLSIAPLVGPTYRAIRNDQAVAKAAATAKSAEQPAPVKSGRDLAAQFPGLDATSQPKPEPAGA